MRIVTTTSDLAALCAELAGSSFVTIDTEFLREKTYWPKLCLVQAAGETTAAIIDPLAKGIDLAPLLELMDTPAVLKVFHAGRQDLEIFYQLAGRVPHPIFDTQVAGMVCGFGEAASYETLARDLAGAQIDKAHRFTDWSRRPLSDAQLEYALSDVTHLRVIYEKLAAKLEKTGRADWLAGEMAVLEDPATYYVQPEEAWRRLKLRTIRPKQLGVLIAAAAWREREAQDRDLPRNRVARDENLYEIAQAAPTSMEALERLRGIGKGLANSRPGERLVEAVKAGMATPRSELPALPQRRNNGSTPTALIDMLKLLLKAQAENHNVAGKLIANSADLEAIALDDNPDAPALTGWRREIFGDLALRLKRGELALSVVNGEVRPVEVSALQP